MLDSSLSGTLLFNSILEEILFLSMLDVRCPVSMKMIRFSFKVAIIDWCPARTLRNHMCVICN